MKEAVTVERKFCTRGRQINHFRQPWNKFRGKQGVGGDRKGDIPSRNQGRIERHGG